MTYVIHNAHLYRPDPTSSVRIYEAPPLAMRVLACDWPRDLPSIRAYLRGKAGSRIAGNGWSGAYVLSGTRASDF